METTGLALAASCLRSSESTPSCKMPKQDHQRTATDKSHTHAQHCHFPPHIWSHLPPHILATCKSHHEAAMCGQCHVRPTPCAAKLPAVTEYPDKRKQWQLTEATSAMAFGLPGRLRASKGEGSELVEEKMDLHAKRNQNPLGHPHHLINELLHINAPTPHD
jgi:hypothetical protein